MKITDVSVSRIHAILEYKNNKIFLYDNNSKYGTLYLIRDSVKVSLKNISLQIGRTYCDIVKIDSSVKNYKNFLKIHFNKNSELNSSNSQNKINLLEYFYKKIKDINANKKINDNNNKIIKETSDKN